jgi:serine/threonine-protein kinase
MQILAHLEHPHIVRSLASIEHEGQLVLVLELLQGRTLREELVARGKLTWQEAVETTARITEALVVAHGQAPPIVHRDLKPENVMLTAAATGVPAGLKVMDFGIAKMLQAAHATNTQSVGTLQYMSPEQIDAQTIDARSDLYSLGLVFYEMLAGQPPFRSASPRELLNQQCSSAPPELPEDARAGLPRGVETLLFDLLEKSPDARPASAKVVVERLSLFRSSASGASSGRGSRTPSPPAAASPASPKAATVSTNAPPEVEGDRLRGDGAGKASTDSSAAAKKRRDDGDGPGRPVPATDTIALVERASAPRQVPLPAAIAAIVLLSIAAGVATYSIRMHSGSPDPAGAVTATAASPPRDPGREPSR